MFHPSQAPPLLRRGQRIWTNSAYESMRFARESQTLGLVLVAWLSYASHASRRLVTVTINPSSGS